MLEENDQRFLTGHPMRGRLDIWVCVHAYSCSKYCIKPLWFMFPNAWNFLMFKLVLEKTEEPEIKLPTSAGSWKKQGSFRKNIYFFFIDYAKAFDSVDHNKLWKILQEMEIPDHLTCLLSNLSCNACQEAPVRTRHEQHTGSKSGKYVKAIYCEFAYLTYMQSTSWKMLD